MNRILIDVSYRDGTTLWFKDGFTTLKGDIMEVAKKIYNISTVRVVNRETNESHVEQRYELYVDYFGLGQDLEYILKDKYDLKIDRCKVYYNHKDYNCDEQNVEEIDWKFNLDFKWNK